MFAKGLCTALWHVCSHHKRAIFVLRTVELEKGDPLKVNTLVNVIAVSSITY